MAVLLDTKGHHRVERYADEGVEHQKILDDGEDILDAEQIDRKRKAAMSSLSSGFKGSHQALSRAEMAKLVTEMNEDEVEEDDDAGSEDADTAEAEAALQRKQEGGSARSGLFGFSRFLQTEKQSATGAAGSVAGLGTST